MQDNQANMNNGPKLYFDDHGSGKVGEIFICNETTDGTLAVQKEFLGKQITGFGGGFDKMFVLEEGLGYEGAVSPLHTIGREQPQQDPDEVNPEDIPYNQTPEGEQYEENSKIDNFEGDPNIQEFHDQEMNERNTQIQRTRGSRRSGTGNGDDRGRTAGSEYEMGNTRTYHEGSSHLKQVVSGKNHIIQLSRDGYVSSFGNDEFSVSGHGGSKIVDTPQILKHLSDKRVVQIACGESHSVILTDKNDVYTWGRGYEGQLGVSNLIEIASKPNYVKGFFKNPVIFVAAGALYSLAITHENKLYGWGEARLGQLGIGTKTRIVKTPVQIPIETEVESPNARASRSHDIDDHPREIEDVKIIYCSAGLGHTLAISDKNELFVWGFNNCGQLGLGDQITRWSPEKMTQDSKGNRIPPFKKAVCSYYSTYAITERGKLYSWGKGYLGHEGKSTEFLPRRVETLKRNFTDVFCNKDMFSVYSPIKVTSIFPNCGPAHGGTVISIVGTGLVDSDKLKVRFTFGNVYKEMFCSFEPGNDSIYCQTPSFEEFEGQPNASLDLPCRCIISVTTDGVNYSECEEEFIICNNIHVESVHPKSGSVQGGAELKFKVSHIEEVGDNTSHLLVGFYPAPKKSQAHQSSKKEVMHSTITKNQSMEEHEENKGKGLNASQHSSALGSNNPAHDETIQNVDTKPEEDNIKTGNWVCESGYYKDGEVCCKVPFLEKYDASNLRFNVDVALNGQQFTGHPLKFRYYDIKIHETVPPNGPSEGGTILQFVGEGMYHSSIQRIKFSAENCSREVEANWNRKSQTISCVVPPLTWLFGGEDVSEEDKKKVMNSGVKVGLTFNNQEWIEVPGFKYHNISISHLAYADNFGEELETEEEKQKLWISEEPIEQPSAELTEEEIKKWEEDKAKRITDEKEEVLNSSRRIGAKMFIYGQNFLKAGDNLRLKFSLGEKSAEVTPIFKNSEKLAVEIPDLGEEIEVGTHAVKIEASVNGQNYTSNGHTFQWNQIDRNMSEEELKKLMEAEEKAKGKGGKKK
ncbi:unnamed protein product [Moneuplotes crassus]|uniref:IPT/TIG domain-containing protein n=3 Tax=Euplotes crassus TaxID=5936 RepID=A0AAD2CZL1_EUPCR|nr:unnamed protein product [Moneuplotes crassus]